MTVAELLEHLQSLDGGDSSRIVCIDTRGAWPGIYPVADNAGLSREFSGGEDYEVVILRPSDWP